MAVEALCPTCGAVFSLRDDMQGKKVRCTKCEQSFTVGGESRSKTGGEKQGVQPRPAPKKGAKDDDEERSTLGKSRAAARRGKDDDEDDDDRPRKSASRRGKDDDDDEDDKPARGKKGKRVYHDDDDDEDSGPRMPMRKKSGSGAGLILGIVGGVVLVLLVLCGGAIYVINSMMEEGANQLQQAANDANRGNPMAGGPMQGDPFNPLATKKINNIDDALRELKSADARDRQAAASWLARTPLDQAQQPAVAQALEPLLAEPDNNSRLAAMRAMKTWAGPGNVPALAKALDDQKLDGANDACKDALAALGRFKDARGADAAARWLPQFFFREDAARALQQMGPVAETAVLKYYNHRDGGVRDKARLLIQGYATKPAAIIAQCAADVRQGTERDTRRDAARWLKTAQADPQQQASVASTLAAALLDTDNEVADAAMDALDTWATADTVPALVKLVEDPAGGGRQNNMRRKAMALLGKLRDVRGAEPVASRLTHSGDRRAAGEALIAMGPVARPAVEKYATNPDTLVRKEVDRILKSYGGDTGNLDLARLLADLKSPDARRRENAAKALTTMKVDETKRAEVAKALEAAVADTSDRFAQEHAIRAMGTWGTKESLAALLKVVDGADQQASCKHAAIEVLVKAKDERVIKPLATRLLDAKERAAAAKHLIALGPELGAAIENEVAAGLTNQDKAVKIECIKILGAVGTRNSIPVLNKAGQAALASKPPQKDVATHCAEAIAAINARAAR
jgi:predicted Zn finger-like uncharacterized protein